MACVQVCWGCGNNVVVLGVVEGTMERAMSFVRRMEFRAAPKGQGTATRQPRCEPRGTRLVSDWLISRTHCIMARDSGPLSPHLGKLTPSVTLRCADALRRLCVVRHSSLGCVPCPCWLIKSTIPVGVNSLEAISPMPTVLVGLGCAYHIYQISDAHTVLG
ncbi:hypothetical protein BC826DRAFT_194085 [Russula brevipes]|nr:hypothetical protein BC826DRAFT_194085 [Russula brevipes]